MTKPLFRKIDCLRVPVPDVEAGLRFYRDALGHELIWRSTTAAGLRLPDSNAEIVIHNEGTGTETDMVEAVDDAVERIVASGGRELRPASTSRSGSVPSSRIRSVTCSCYSTRARGCS